MDYQLCPYCFQLFSGYGPCPYCGHAAGEPRSGAQQLPLGTILDGKYRLGMVLGQGGFGITYLALDLKLQTRVAIKEYFPLGLVTRQAQTVTFSTPNAQPFYQKGVEAFYREAQLLTRFRNHPNIVHVSSFFRQNSTAYFVMEYVEGESLSEYLDRCGGRLSYDETVRLLTPVLDALSDVHNAGILHRDIAPDNICLTKDGNVKLLDFGAAKNELSMHTHSSAAILKPGYAPMEQYTAGSNQGPWTDIYAMGAVIYRCLTGIVPPDAPDRIIGQQLISFKEANVNAPSGAEAAINKALAPDIQNRWQNVADFKKTLIDPSALKNVKSQKIKRNESHKSQKKKRKPCLIPVIVAAVIILAVAGLYSKYILPKEHLYLEGTSLISRGNYDEGIQILNEITDYRDAKQQIRNAKSYQAEEYLALDDYEHARTLFTELSGAEYAERRIQQRQEEYALQHPTPTALETLLEEAKGSEQSTPEPEKVLVQNDLQKQLSNLRSGDIFSFGRYEQDGNKDNGTEDIEWIVLEKTDEKLFVLSKYGLDWGSFDQSDNGLDGLRSENWLNSNFMTKAFTDDEVSIISDTLLSAIDENDDSLSDKGIVWKKLFLLSVEDVENYLPNLEDRIINGTVYTDKNSRGGSNWWWLRSVPKSDWSKYNTTSWDSKQRRRITVEATETIKTCAYVTYNGQIDDSGVKCSMRGLIRPAMRINLYTEIDKPADFIEGNQANSENTSSIEEVNEFIPIFEEKDVIYPSDVQAGDIIQFGSYEQDGKLENGKEPIDWIILEKQEDKMLLLSKFILDNQSYHRKNEQVTWETCDLRNWLNNDFVSSAFTEQEQSLLLETEITTPDFDAGITSSSDGKVLLHDLYLDGSVVKDRCFVLNYEEIEMYLKVHERNAVSSDYSNFDFWYIRSGNCNQIQHYSEYDADLYFSPVITDYGKLASVVSQTQHGVRPAIWVKYK